MEVGLSNVVLDNVHLWVADHGVFGGWGGSCSHICQYRVAAATSGLVVSGARVFCYGLCVEHFHAGPYLDWNGADGAVFGYMSELSYYYPGAGNLMPNPVIVVGPDASNFRLVVSALYAFNFGVGMTQADPCIRVQNKTATVSSPGTIGSPCKVLWG